VAAEIIAEAWAGGQGRLSDFGAAASPALPAGEPTGGALPPGRPAPHAQAASPRRHAPRKPATAASWPGPSSTRRASSHRESSPSRALPAVACPARRCAPPLTASFPGKTSAPVRRTGTNNVRPSPTRASRHRRGRPSLATSRDPTRLNSYPGPARKCRPWLQSTEPAGT
jgi:hypothetical protein